MFRSMIDVDEVFDRMTCVEVDCDTNSAHFWKQNIN